MIIYEWRTKLYIAYCSQWTWPKWVVPYRLWRFQHKFEQPKSSPYYFSFPLIFSVTHIYKYMHTCMLDNAMSLVSLPAPPHKYLNPILFRVSWCVPIYLFVVLKRCNIHQARHTCHGKLSLHSPAFPVQRKCLANKKVITNSSNKLSKFANGWCSVCNSVSDIYLYIYILKFYLYIYINTCILVIGANQKISYGSLRGDPYYGSGVFT